jgi:hypothetical protein
MADSPDTIAETTSKPTAPSTGLTTPTEIESLPYWLVNVPQDQWPAECPEFLRNLNSNSIECLATPDKEFKKHDWEMITETIS